VPSTAPLQLLVKCSGIALELETGLPGQMVSPRASGRLRLPAAD
jgi:hypothetical protein